MLRIPSRKRPCRICKRWFLPNPRLKERQKTCGRQRCQKAWHRKKCAQWNRKNADYFKANYLQKKIESAAPDSGVCDTPGTVHRQISVPISRMKTGLPFVYVQEVIGIKHIIIIEYLAQLLDRRRRQATLSKSLAGTRLHGPQPRSACSRGDPGLTCCNH